MLEIFFFKNHTENEARTLVQDLFFVSTKSLNVVKATGSIRVSIYFGIPRLGQTIKTN